MSNPNPIPKAFRLHELSLNKSGENGVRKFIPFKGGTTAFMNFQAQTA
ncbi:MAG: hypothetical protein GX416_09820 [Bacteroidales bacterium]|nr:hypothetical protein [Bacteroidales bacterium]